MPLLHGAHVQSEGQVSIAGGMTGQFATGAVATSIQDARETTVAGLSPVADSTERYRKGALAITAVSPGLSPFLSGRVGLGGNNEAGLSYSGRATRIDARHAFSDETWALSVGLGAHALLMRGEENHAALSGLQLGGVKGWGVDVPIVAGWQSKAQLFSAWAGARLGYERLGGEIGLASADAQSDRVGLAGSRLWGGGVFGLSGGFRHLFVAFEIDALYQHASATMGESDVKLSGLTIAPSGALVGHFLRTA